MEQVRAVFEEIQEQKSVSSKNVYSLLELYTNDVKSDKIMVGIMQCYLRIIKNIARAPKQEIKKYEQLTDKLFATAYEDLFQ